MYKKYGEVSQIILLLLKMIDVAVKNRQCCTLSGIFKVPTSRRNGNSITCLSIVLSQSNFSEMDKDKQAEI